MKPIIILDAFITDKQDEGTLLNFINSIKTTGDDLLLMSNTTTSKEVQDKRAKKYLENRLPPTLNSGLYHINARIIPMIIIDVYE